MPRFLYPAVYHEIPAHQLISQGLAQGLRFLPLEHELPRLLRRAHFGGGEGRLAIHRGIACRWQPAVALAQGDIEAGGQEEDHVAARLRAPGFEETEMTGRDSGLQSEA